MLQEAAKESLAQLRDVIGQCSDEEYRRQLEVLGGASLGQHIRHTLEFFVCLEEGIKTRRVSYDRRAHDQLVETDKVTATELIQTLTESFGEPIADFPLVFEANYSRSALKAVEIRSSFYRELSYVIEHSVHHMALIAVGVRSSFRHIHLPEDFGVANSTVRHLEKQQSR